LESRSTIFPPFSAENEDKGSYCLGWNSSPCSPEEVLSSVSSDAWVYKEVAEQIPIWGEHGMYPAGGYVADFAVNT
jgi:hypothetical protein